MCLWPGLWVTPRPPGIHVYPPQLGGLLGNKSWSSVLKFHTLLGPDWETEAPQHWSLPSAWCSTNVSVNAVSSGWPPCPWGLGSRSGLLSPCSQFPPVELASFPTWAPNPALPSFCVFLVTPAPFLPAPAAMPWPQGLWSLLDSGVLS